MVSEYSEYSGLSEEQINYNISNVKNIINEEFTKFNKIELLVSSSNLIYDLIQYPFSVDKEMMSSKYQLFSPYMLPLIINSGYGSFLEYMGGVGILSELVKSYCPNMDVNYTSLNNNITNFALWRFRKNNIGVNVGVDSTKRYDIVVSDGVLQFLGKNEQEIVLKNMINIISKNGILCLLMDITGEDPEQPLKHSVDVISLHHILEQSDMVCIYGKNTFSSLWKKMI